MVQFDDMNEQEQMQMLMSQLQDSNLRQSVMQCINQTANALDTDANSKALIATLARESVHHQKSTAMWRSRTKKSIAVGVVAVVLAITVQFLVNYFTNELSKESHVDKQGAMLSTDGKVVKTQMEEMKVDADGKLLSRNSGASVKTMPTLAKVALASSLPDDTLMALDEITVHSDKGYTLQIKVHGFSRVPVLNSRCGNIVHFYTAWKGKVTLDSTDLSLDEVTAAEFKNAGFSLATGGRRLAGKITVDGFAKALDGMKKAGKWTCADVPLPIFSELGDRKEVNYDACGRKDDKTSICYSRYGGLKVGVTALEEGVASAVTSKIDRMGGKRTESLFVKSSSSVMNSELYRVSFSEYPSHPGQQLVAISDLKSGDEVRFQMELDKSRSHCMVRKDANQRALHEAQNNDKLDSDWHFEYMGTNEEDGQMLRHFRILLSSEFTNYVFGDASKASLLNFAEFWDVAETMQPERLIIGDTGDNSITVFESYTQGITDADVQAAVKTLTGKTVAELMVCSAQEATTNTARPEMVLFGDLSRQDAGYYVASSATKSETLSKYLYATGNSWAMPDVCYEKCKTSVDAVLRRDTTEICQGTALASALQCLEETGMVACFSSEFSNDHLGECQSNEAVRTLQESEEAAELLVNESLKPVSAPRNLAAYSKCPGKMGVINIGFVVYPGEGAGLCVKFYVPLDAPKKPPNYKKLSKAAKAKIKSKAEKAALNLATYGTKGVAPSTANTNLKDEEGKPAREFILEIGYVHLEFGKYKNNTAHAIYIKCLFCIDLVKVLGLPPPVYCEVCVGGKIEFRSRPACPGSQAWDISGNAFICFEIGLDFWVVRIVAGAIELGIEAGRKHFEEGFVICHQVTREGRPRRRRYGVVVTYVTTTCNYNNYCDVYVKGYLQVQYYITRIKLEFAYYFSQKVLEIKMYLYAWGWKWWEAYTTVIFRRDFNNIRKQKLLAEYDEEREAEWAALEKKRKKEEAKAERHRIKQLKKGHEAKMSYEEAKRFVGLKKGTQEERDEKQAEIQAYEEREREKELQHRLKNPDSQAGIKAFKFR